MLFKVLNDMQNSDVPCTWVHGICLIVNITFATRNLTGFTEANHTLVMEVFTLMNSFSSSKNNRNNNRNKKFRSWSPLPGLIEYNLIISQLVLLIPILVKDWFWANSKLWKSLNCEDCVCRQYRCLLYC